MQSYILTYSRIQREPLVAWLAASAEKDLILCVRGAPPQETCAGKSCEVKCVVARGEISVPLHSKTLDRSKSDVGNDMQNRGA